MYNKVRKKGGIFMESINLENLDDEVLIETLEILEGIKDGIGGNNNE